MSKFDPSFGGERGLNKSFVLPPPGTEAFFDPEQLFKNHNQVAS